MQLFNKLKSMFRRDNGIDGISVEAIDNVEDIVAYANTLCDSITKYNKEESDTSKKIKHYSNIIDDIKKISKFDKETIKEFDTLLQTLSNSKEERYSLQEELNKLNTQVDESNSYSSDLTEIISEIERAEEKQRLAKSDMNYLEGEKGYLDYNFEKLIKTKKFLKYFTIGFTLVIALVLLGIMVISTNREFDFFMPGLILFIATLFGVTWIYILRRYIIHETKLNIMKKKKAAQLLNKAKLKYVRYTKYLDYEYNKYGVKSSEVLRNNWSRYTNYQTANKRYKRLSEYTSGLLERLDYMLNKYSITEIDYILENSDMLSTKLRRTEIYKTIMDEKQQCENNLAEIMNEQKKVMSILNGIKYKNEKHIPLIDKIVEEKIIAKSM